MLISSISTNLPPTAYVKMIDYWLIFNLLKPFVDIIVQTYIETLRDDNKKEGEEEEEKVFPLGDEAPKEVWLERKKSSGQMNSLKYKIDERRSGRK